MHTPVRRLALAVPVALLLAAAAAAAPAPHPTTARRVLPTIHPASPEREPVTAPALLSSVPADVPLAALNAQLRGTVTLSVRVARTGLVDSVRVLGGDPRLRAAAVTSARWWVFAPPAGPTWTTIKIDVDGRQDADPLLPDVLAMESDAERRGAPWEAIDACVGALGRVGTHPRLQNPWAIREHAIRLARKLPGKLKVPGALMTVCQQARGQQLRTMASASHQNFVKSFDDALLVCPWWADGYQWRAASLLQCGQGVEAMRSLVLFRAAAADTAARSLANRALAGIAAGDTLGVSRMLMHEGVQFNRDEDADH